MRMTAKGQKLFEQLLPLILRFEQDTLRKLKIPEQRMLLEGLSALEREMLPKRGIDT
jgi:DNA-binding MarR family transcriptional regulator